MTRKNLFGIVSTLSLVLASFFIYSPVFAENPVDIDIIEMVDDGSGNLKPWEDITGAMPGMTYSAIPRIKNNGSVSVSVRMCLSESATNNGGDSIILPENTFTINVNDAYWAKEIGGANGSSISSPISVCYKYVSELSANSVTEPLFYEVKLSGELDNEYENATFNLHLDADAVGDLPDNPSENTSGNLPNNPDTGKSTITDSFTTTGIIFYALGIATFIASIVYLIRSFRTKK